MNLSGIPLGVLVFFLTLLSITNTKLTKLLLDLEIAVETTV